MNATEAVKLPEQDPKIEPNNPTEKEFDIVEFLSSRVDVLRAYRKRKLPGISRSVEDIWREADREYTPHELSFEQTGTRIESDDDTGWRGRVVKIGQDGWQSNQASPDLYVKVNSALGILVDMNPEAVFLPSSKKYQANTKLAYGNWKNSWEISGAKQQIKNFVFNMAKYGMGVGRTYPKIIEMQKRVRTEFYKNESSKDKFEERRIVKFNDLCRESLNPWQVWLSEMTRPGDWNSIDDWYFEKDFSWDRFQKEFEDYEGINKVPKGSFQTLENDAVSDETSGNKVTVGFYENQVLDIFAVWVPSAKILLYSSPLPNDDGMLSLWFAPWTLRDDRCPYGIGIYEIIRNDSIMFDRLLNMTMDQLTLSIYKMFFYKGTDILGGNNQFIVEAGRGIQVSDPKAITFLDIPGPGQESWRGLQYLQDRKDLTSGVTQQLTGKFAGQTLGQDMQAKETALDRMKTPLDFILDALQQEAYIAISWQKQILSTPEILEYADEDDLVKALKEMDVSDEDIQKYLSQAQTPEQNNELFFTDGSIMEETGQPRKFANIFREVSYGLEQDEKGELIESKENQFYRFGLDLPTHRLNWKGIIRIKPQSILVPSKELTKRMKLDLFNLLYPAINAMLAAPQFVLGLLPPIRQILKVYEEEMDEWIDEEFLKQLSDQALQPKGSAMPEVKVSLSVKFETLPIDVQTEVIQKYMGIKQEQPLFIDKNQSGQSQIQEEQLQQPLFINAKDQAPQIKPLAQLGEAPQTMGGAVSGAMQVE